jgi:hypothetical protein
MLCRFIAVKYRVTVRAAKTAPPILTFDAQPLADAWGVGEHDCLSRILATRQAHTARPHSSGSGEL